MNTTAVLVLALAIIGGGAVGLLILALNEKLESRRWNKVYKDAWLDYHHYGKGTDDGRT